MAIDLLDVLDWDALAAADPTWLVGFSDLCTVMVPLTTRLGWATLHGSNLMDTPYAAPDGFVHWTDLASATGPVTQTSLGRYRSRRSADYSANPDIDTIEMDAAGGWNLLDGGYASFSGRLVGGCIEVLSPLKGTPFGAVAEFGREHADDGLVVYLEASESNAFDVARALHGFRLAGWFEQANGVLIGRTSAPDSDGLTQREAVADALGGLDLPVVLDVECGHVAPYLPLVNGAMADVDTGRTQIIQTLV
jgi:muramoyltetrapeptide carboxypeptidase LdcA involved in peptidoglycan recycling